MSRYYGSKWVTPEITISDRSAWYHGDGFQRIVFKQSGFTVTAEDNLGFSHVPFTTASFTKWQNDNEKGFAFWWQVWSTVSIIEEEIKWIFNSHCLFSCSTDFRSSSSLALTAFTIVAWKSSAPLKHTTRSAWACDAWMHKANSSIGECHAEGTIYTKALLEAAEYMRAAWFLSSIFPSSLLLYLDARICDALISATTWRK